MITPCAATIRAHSAECRDGSPLAAVEAQKRELILGLVGRDHRVLPGGGEAGGVGSSWPGTDGRERLCRMQEQCWQRHAGGSSPCSGNPWV